MGKYLIGTFFLLIQMMIFIQGYQEMAMHYTKQSIVTIVETHAQMARMQGHFTPSLKQSMFERIGDLDKVDENNITYELTETLVCTREDFSVNDQIKYEIIIPIEQSNVPIFGSSDDVLEYPMRGVVTSEKKCGEV